MRTSVQGILYPTDAASTISFHESGVASAGNVLTIPHMAWSRCSDRLNRLFSGLRGRTFQRVFVLGPLHMGPLVSDHGSDLPSVYSPEDGSLIGSDWAVELSLPQALRPLVQVSDDICSEEFSLEIVAPYLSLLFPATPVCHLLAAEAGGCPEIAEILRRDFPTSLFLISNNDETNCAYMWKEAFGI